MIPGKKFFCKSRVKYILAISQTLLYSIQIYFNDKNVLNIQTSTLYIEFNQTFDSLISSSYEISIDVIIQHKGKDLKLSAKQKSFVDISKT